jgi:hypothetical protein
MPFDNSLVLALAVAVGALTILNVMVSTRLMLYGGLTTRQKAMQLMAIWLLPIIGALLVDSLIVSRSQRGTGLGLKATSRDSPHGVRS